MGYRIFYGNAGENVSLPSVATSISLTLNVNLIGQTVSLCTEVEQFASQCTNATVEDTSRVVTGNKQHFTVKITMVDFVFFVQI